MSIDILNQERQYPIIKCHPDNDYKCIFDDCLNLSLKGLHHYDHINIDTNIDYCPSHTGHKRLEAEQNRNKNQYFIENYKKHFKEFDNDAITSLKGEIIILRTLIKIILEECGGDTTKTIIYSTKIGDLIQKCEKLVSSFDRIESKINFSVTRTQLLKWASTIINIIDTHVSDKQIVNAIGNDIADSLQKESFS